MVATVASESVPHIGLNPSTVPFEMASVALGLGKLGTSTNSKGVPAVFASFLAHEPAVVRPKSQPKILFKKSLSLVPYVPVITITPPSFTQFLNTVLEAVGKKDSLLGSPDSISVIKKNTLVSN